MHVAIAAALGANRFSVTAWARQQPLWLPHRDAIWLSNEQPVLAAGSSAFAKPGFPFGMQTAHGIVIQGAASGTALESP
jgi:hypothetical protein